MLGKKDYFKKINIKNQYVNFICFNENRKHKYCIWIFGMYQSFDIYII